MTPTFCLPTAIFLFQLRLSHFETSHFPIFKNFSLTHYKCHPLQPPSNLTDTSKLLQSPKALFTYEKVVIRSIVLKSIRGLCLEACQIFFKYIGVHLFVLLFRGYLLLTSSFWASALYLECFKGNLAILSTNQH